MEVFFCWSNVLGVYHMICERSSIFIKMSKIAKVAKIFSLFGRKEKKYPKIIFHYEFFFSSGYIYFEFEFFFFLKTAKYIHREKKMNWNWHCVCDREFLMCDPLFLCLFFLVVFVFVFNDDDFHYKRVHAWHALKKTLLTTKLNQQADQ